MSQDDPSVDLLEEGASQNNVILHPVGHHMVTTIWSRVIWCGPELCSLMWASCVHTIYSAMQPQNRECLVNSVNISSHGTLWVTLLRGDVELWGQGECIYTLRVSTYLWALHILAVTVAITNSVVDAWGLCILLLRWCNHFLKGDQHRTFTKTFTS